MMVVTLRCGFAHDGEPPHATKALLDPNGPGVIDLACDGCAAIAKVEQFSIGLYDIRVQTIQEVPEDA